MRTHVAWFVLLDLVLLCMVTGLSGCAQRGDELTFVSEFILLCKRGARTAALPWLCWLAFAAVVLVQLPWMFGAAQLFAEKSGASEVKTARTDDGHGAFWWCACAAVLGFLFVVVFDWRDRGPAEIWLHRVGVVTLSAGLFLALHLVWLNLKVAESNTRLRSEAAHASRWKWAGYDAVFVCVLLVFLLTSLLGTNQTVSVTSEYVAFAMLFVQTTWLMLACWECEENESIDVLSGTGLSFPASVGALLLVYGATSAVVVAAATSLRA